MMSVPAMDSRWLMDLTLLLLVLLAMTTRTDAEDATLRILERGDLRIAVALPDRENGHYRGIRFDPGGIVTAATWRGHSFFGTLKQPRDPAAHDGASGAPEEFNPDHPPGYAEGSPGDLFLKIGVGALVKADDKPYHFFTAYMVKAWARWTVSEEPGAISCHQESAAGAYACRETRTVRIHADGAGFTIERELTATGQAPLAIDHYNHAMICIDDDAIGPAYVLTFPAPVTVADPSLVGAGAQVHFRGALLAKSSAWSPVHGLPQGAQAAEVAVTNTIRGLTITLSSDTAPDRVIIYAESTALCPECFTTFTVLPGATQRWSQNFRFSASEPAAP